VVLALLVVSLLGNALLFFGFRVLVRRLDAELEEARHRKYFPNIFKNAVFPDPLDPGWQIQWHNGAITYRHGDFEVRPWAGGGAIAFVSAQRIGEANDMLAALAAAFAKRQEDRAIYLDALGRKSAAERALKELDAL
jgi:hypothetical protein